MENGKTTVVIPCRNEGANIGALVRETYKYADSVIVVNDQSTDDTCEAARAEGAHVLVTNRFRRGLSDVYSQGLKYACIHGHKFIVEMDAGGSHDPADIPKLLAPFEGQVIFPDLVYSRRFGPDAEYLGTWQRRLLSWGGTQLFNLRHGTSWWDATGGFIAYRRDSLSKLLEVPYESRGHFYQSEVRQRARQYAFIAVEVPITYRNSSSSLNWRSIGEALRLV